MKITVYEYMEDFDNAELPDGAWQEQLEDAVREYNETFGTTHDPYNTFVKYIRMGADLDR